MWNDLQDICAHNIKDFLERKIKKLRLGNRSGKRLNFTVQPFVSFEFVSYTYLYYLLK